MHTVCAYVVDFNENRYHSISSTEQKYHLKKKYLDGESIKTIKNSLVNNNVTLCTFYAESESCSQYKKSCLCGDVLCFGWVFSYFFQFFCHIFLFNFKDFSFAKIFFCAVCWMFFFAGETDNVQKYFFCALYGESKTKHFIAIESESEC